MSNIEASLIQVHVARIAEDGMAEYLILHRSAEEALYPNVWQVITGAIDPGETALEAARREMEEETGIAPLHFATAPFITSFFDTDNDTVILVPVFLSIVPLEMSVTLSIEHQDYAWVRYEELLGRLVFPSHVEGARIVDEYLLSGKRKGLLDLMNCR
jgi:dihydroneopterin triphosphate diphosphatase